MESQRIDDHASDLETLTTSTGDVASAVFIVPFGAPMPNEAKDILVTTGSLFTRLAPLDEEAPATNVVIPLSGQELLGLSNVWHHLVLTKKVFVLGDLPGAKYDVLFDQAARGIGLKTVPWPEVSDAITRQLIETQRVGDTKPWLLENQEQSTEAPAPRGKLRSSTKAQPLVAPGDDHEDID